MFSNYFKQIVKKPQEIILFNIDGIFEIFLNMKEHEQSILAVTIKNVFEKIDGESKRRLILLTPKNARKIIGF